MLNFCGPPTGLFLYLADRRVSRRLFRIEDPSRELPAPLTCGKPVAPQHQNVLVVVHDDSQNNCLQPDHVVFKAMTIRWLDVHKRQAYPRVVIDGALPMDLGTQLIGAIRIGHA
jgi:hypothetical protein